MPGESARDYVQRVCVAKARAARERLVAGGHAALPFQFLLLAPGQFLQLLGQFVHPLIALLLVLVSIPATVLLMRADGVAAQTTEVPA